MRKILVIIAILGSVWILTSVCQVQYLVSTIKLNLRIFKDPNENMAYYNRAVVKRECNDNKGAFEDFTQVLRIDPSDANTYHQRGRVRQRMGDVKGVLGDYQKAVEIYTQKGQIWYRERVVDDIRRMPLLQKKDR